MQKDLGIIKLVNIDDIFKDENNPRKVDSYILEHIKKSLGYLGWTVPVVSTIEGQILSGHQRTTCWRAMGETHIPVMFIKLNTKRDKNINILFNTAINDFNSFFESGYKEININLDNKKNTSTKFPCIDNIDYNCTLSKLKENNEDLLNKIGTTKFYSKLMVKKIFIPIVIDSNYKILNGKFRFLEALSEGLNTHPVVIIKDNVDLVGEFMNKLSMNFDLDIIGDYIRYNSYRRPKTIVKSLTWGLTYTILLGKYTANFIYNSPINTKRIKKLFGQKRILDYGAGQLLDVDKLQSLGVNIIGYEPFFVVDGQVDTIKSNELLSNMIKDFQGNGKFDIIYSSAVLNSIPFKKDRVQVLNIVSYLLDTNGVYISWTQSIKLLQSSEKRAEDTKIKISSSETLAGFQEGTPKLQKYYTEKELYNMYKLFFNTVKVTEVGTRIYIIAKDPIYDIEKTRIAFKDQFTMQHEFGQLDGYKLIEESLT